MEIAQQVQQIMASVLVTLVAVGLVTPDSPGFCFRRTGMGYQTSEAGGK